MNGKMYQLALAGLLHDIGKVMLRAGIQGTRSWDAEAKRDFRYKHAMLAASFVATNVPKVWQQEVGLMVGDHHNPQRKEDRIVTLADWFSAAERDDGGEDDRSVHPKQMLSIFAALRADGKTLDSTARSQAYLPLKPLALQRETIFPQRALFDENEVWKVYRKLWADFEREAATLKQVHEFGGDVGAYLESMFLLMQRYFWSVPSAYYKSIPDISLFDHSRMTAALAVVLSDLDDTTIISLLKHPQNDHPVALLVGGDISGVQDFIYTITNRGATSALRGRSFYLQLLTEAVARYLLRRLDLPITNLIYQGGGNFYLLARPSDVKHLMGIQRDVGGVLLQHHRGDLYAALAGELLSGQDFFGGRISKKWKALGDKMQRMKLRRFSELDDDQLQWLFEPLGNGGNEDRLCQVCGREHPLVEEIKRPNGDSIRVCPSCRSYEDLGKDLRKARYLMLERLPVEAIPAVDLDKVPGDYVEVLATFGVKATLSQEIPISTNVGEILALKDEALIGLRPGAKMAVGRRFFVNVTPVLSSDEFSQFRDKVNDLPRPGSIKPFEVLARQSRGINRLGVMRMDVDNLGKLFSEGLGEKATLSRVATLSFTISLYFEGWVEKLAEKQKVSVAGWSDRLYSVYSGGDDLFFVGSWDAVVDFARQVRADLADYAAGHSGIHASAGLVLIGDKYPLARAAQDAGNAEDAAKGYQVWDKSREKMVMAKDAVSFLGQVQPWSLFGLTGEPGLTSVSGLTRLLTDMSDARRGPRGTAPRSLIRNLSRLYAQYAGAERRRQLVGEDVTQNGQPQPLWGPWMWRGYYMLRRMAGRTKMDDIEQLADNLHDDDFRNMAWMGLAARWAELLTR